MKSIAIAIALATFFLITNCSNSKTVNKDPEETGNKDPDLEQNSIIGTWQLIEMKTAGSHEQGETVKFESDKTILITFYSDNSFLELDNNFPDGGHVVSVSASGNYTITKIAELKVPIRFPLSDKFTEVINYRVAERDVKYKAGESSVKKVNIVRRELFFFNSEGLLILSPYNGGEEAGYVYSKTFKKISK